MFGKSKKKGGSQPSGESLEQQFKTVKNNDIELIGFYEKLFLTPDLKPYWLNIYAAMNQIHAEENLDFFVDYLNLIKEPSLIKWNALYDNWIKLDTSAGFLTGTHGINITGRLKDLLTRLHSNISQQEKKSFNLDKILLEDNEEDQVYTARSLLDLAAAEVLKLISNDSADTIGDILAKPLSELTGSGHKKKKEKEGKKEKKASSKM